MTSENYTQIVRWPTTATTPTTLEGNATTTTTTTTQSQTDVTLQTLDIIVVAIYIAILMLGFTGNLMVVHYFGFHNKVRRLYHIYLIHLAVADLISATVTSGYFVSSVVSGYTWLLGEFSCKLITLIAPVTVNVSAWILVSIAHERYRGIISPFKPRLTKLRIHMTVAAIWVFSFLVLTPYALSINLVGASCHVSWKSPIYELSYAAATLVVQSLVPIIYMTFTVTRILNVLRNRMIETNPTASKYSNFSRETSFMSSSYQPTDVSTRYGGVAVEASVEETETNRLISRRRGTEDHICNGAKLTLQSKAKTLSVPSLIVSINSEGNDKESCVFNITKPTMHHSRTNLKKTQSVFLLPEQNQLQRQKQRQIATSQSSNHLCMTTTIDNNNTPQKLKPQQQRCSVKYTLDHEQNYDNSSQSGSFRGRGEGMKRRIRASISRSRESVYNRIRKLLHHNKTDKSRKRNPVRQQQRIAMLIVTFSVFVVCSLPYNIFYIVAIVIYDFVKDHTQLVLLRNFHVWLSTLVVSNTIMNCFIYAGMDKGFQIYIRRIFTCTWYKYKQEEKLRKKNRGSLTASIRK